MVAGAFCCNTEGVALKNSPLRPAGPTPPGLMVKAGLAGSKGLLPRVNGFVVPTLKLKAELGWVILVVVSEEEVVVGVLKSNFDSSDFVAATL